MVRYGSAIFYCKIILVSSLQNPENVFPVHSFRRLFFKCTHRVSISRDLLRNGLCAEAPATPTSTAEAVLVPEHFQLMNVKVSKEFNTD